MTAPAPVALVVCDHFYKEASGKTALVGLFNQITATRFPAKHPRMCVYASVTDIRPNTHLKLDIVNSETDHVVMSLEGPPPPKATPLVVCDLNFDLQGLVFPEPGLYLVRLWGGDRLLLQRPIEVALTKKAKKVEDPE